MELYIKGYQRHQRQNDRNWQCGRQKKKWSTKINIRTRGSSFNDSLTDPFLPAKAIALKLSPLFKTTRWTVSRRLKEIGLKPYVPRKKPLITEVNQEKRYKWAEKHVEWKESAWQHVVFSDETPVTLFQWTGRRLCQKRQGTGFQENILDQL